MISCTLHNPAAAGSRAIERALIFAENSKYPVVYLGLHLLTKIFSTTVFPALLFTETVFKRLPRVLGYYTSAQPLLKADQTELARLYDKKKLKLEKFILGILFSPLGFRSADIVSGLFLKLPHTDTLLRPFGVEMLYGKSVPTGIRYPRTFREVQDLVNHAIIENKKITVIGSGMSQGTQTVPVDFNTLVIHTKFLNDIVFSEDHQTVSAQAGATWEQIQVKANQLGKSVIVKQASDLFSIGGSIGINCHGWHKFGSIATTVLSLTIIDARGQIRTLYPDDELFGCMFGTLGYFGIVLSATLQLVDNCYLIEKTTEVDLKDFTQVYESEIKEKGYSLFGGRLSLDRLDPASQHKVCMVHYEIDPDRLDSHRGPVVDLAFGFESTLGSRIQRVSLQAMSHLSFYTVSRMLSAFWKNEKVNMFSGRMITRNEALHPPINAFRLLQRSNLHAMWLQEYFIKKENLESFIEYLYAVLNANEVLYMNLTIRVTPRDTISLLPYAEQDRFAVVICFSQLKTERAITKTLAWMNEINERVIRMGDKFYLAYMPVATKKQFTRCYGEETLANLRRLKAIYDPNKLFESAYTKTYFTNEN